MHIIYFEAKYKKFDIILDYLMPFYFLNKVV